MKRDIYKEIRDINLCIDFEVLLLGMKRSII
jgi:hypothetical protein